ncbi:hypothetical protein QJS04_geneDACA023491 [Acorus gramineus]|uniref:Uncharacterized protein n=1 Tax=Acorus gramineus TaxID=55184 RepID=A0AAV9B276_ACOGR|nr:hypothetical protein QJS04_geneDACA023491 [Acorus gramineus]
MEGPKFQIEGDPFVKKLVYNDDSRFCVVGTCNHLISASPPHTIVTQFTS